MKRLRTIFKWSYRLAILGALAYFLQPFYAPPKPTRPSSLGADDFVTWKFPEDPNSTIYETLKVFGDGRSIATVVRTMADPDAPEVGQKAGWTFKGDKKTGLVEYKKEDLLSPEKSKNILNAALEAGLLDLQEEKRASEDRMEIQCSFGGKLGVFVGPRHIANAAGWQPEVWNNRLRWQKIAALIESDPTLRSILTKKQVNLVNE